MPRWLSAEQVGASDPMGSSIADGTPVDGATHPPSEPQRAKGRPMTSPARGTDLSRFHSLGIDDGRQAAGSGARAARQQQNEDKHGAEDEGHRERQWQQRRRRQNNRKTGVAGGPSVLFSREAAWNSPYNAYFRQGCPAGEVPSLDTAVPAPTYSRPATAPVQDDQMKSRSPAGSDNILGRALQARMFASSSALQEEPQQQRQDQGDQADPERKQRQKSRTAGGQRVPSLNSLGRARTGRSKSQKRGVSSYRDTTETVEAALQRMPEELSSDPVVRDELSSFFPAHEQTKMTIGSPFDMPLLMARALKDASMKFEAKKQKWEKQVRLSHQQQLEDLRQEGVAVLAAQKAAMLKASEEALEQQKASDAEASARALADALEEQMKRLTEEHDKKREAAVAAAVTAVRSELQAEHEAATDAAARAAAAAQLAAVQEAVATALTNASVTHAVELAEQQAVMERAATEQMAALQRRLEETRLLRERDLATEIATNVARQCAQHNDEKVQDAVARYAADAAIEAGRQHERERALAEEERIVRQAALREEAETLHVQLEHAAEGLARAQARAAQSFEAQQDAQTERDHAERQAAAAREGLRLARARAAAAHRTAAQATMERDAATAQRDAAEAHAADAERRAEAEAGVSAIAEARAESALAARAAAQESEVSAEARVRMAEAAEAHAVVGARVAQGLRDEDDRFAAQLAQSGYGTGCRPVTADAAGAHAMTAGDAVRPRTTEAADAEAQLLHAEQALEHAELRRVHAEQAEIQSHAAAEAAEAHAAEAQRAAMEASGAKAAADSEVARLQQQEMNEAGIEAHAKRQAAEACALAAQAAEAEAKARAVAAAAEADVAAAVEQADANASAQARAAAKDALVALDNAAAAATDATEKHRRAEAALQSASLARKQSRQRLLALGAVPSPRFGYAADSETGTDWDTPTASAATATVAAVEKTKGGVHVFDDSHDV